MISMIDLWVIVVDCDYVDRKGCENGHDVENSLDDIQFSILGWCKKVYSNCDRMTTINCFVISVTTFIYDNGDND